MLLNTTCESARVQVNVFGVRLINFKKGKGDFKKGNCHENLRCVNESNNLFNGFGRKGGSSKKGYLCKIKGPVTILS